MLGVETVVGGLVHHVAGEDVIVFVEGERFAMDDEGHLHCLDDEKGEDCRPCPLLCSGHCGGGLLCCGQHVRTKAWHCSILPLYLFILRLLRGVCWRASRFRSRRRSGRGLLADGWRGPS